jgi:hypothetical protein
MPSITFPGGGPTLTWTALTPAAITGSMQDLTCQMLGIDTTADPLAYKKVRVDWLTSGQPGWGIADDVCFVRCTETDRDFTKTRDRQYAQNGSTSLNRTETYTRVWRVDWALYGPDSFDNARLIRSAVRLEFAHDALAAIGLALVPAIPAPVRAPELFQGQWWERVDVHAEFYELVTETLSVDAVASVEVLIETNDLGLVDDITA